VTRHASTSALSSRKTRYFNETVAQIPIESVQIQAATRQEALTRQQAVDETAHRFRFLSVVHTQIIRNVFPDPAAVNLDQIVWTLPVNAGTNFECHGMAYRFHDPALQASTDLSVRMEANNVHIAPSWVFEGDGAGSLYRRIRPSYGDPSSPIAIEPVVVPGPSIVTVVVSRNVVAWVEFVSLTITVVGRLIQVAG
jgi:hypothetical protein